MVRKVIGASCALVLLAVAVALLPQRGRAEDTEPVLVVNGPKKPVPVTLVAGSGVGINGTPSVNVANTPGVTVANQPTVNLAPGGSVGIAGTPNVNVTGTPNVNIANTPTVALAPGTAFAIKDSAAAIEPVHASVEIDSPNGSPPPPLLTVPAGKRFVLDDISVDSLAAGPGGGAQFYPGLFAGVFWSSGAGNFDEIDLPMFVNVQYPNHAFLQGGRTVRAYADAGAVIQAFANNQSGIGSYVTVVTINGYYVNL